VDLLAYEIYICVCVCVCVCFVCDFGKSMLIKREGFVCVYCKDICVLCVCWE